MRLILDTNVVSELRKTHSGKAADQVARWAKSVDNTNFYLSVIVIMELERGIFKLERKDPGQAQILRWWLENEIIPGFSGRILNIDIQTARRCAQLHVPNIRSHTDALIAATALVHGMTVVTRNVEDFASTGVQILNPWEAV